MPTLTTLTAVNCLVPPGLCPGYGPCTGGAYIMQEPIGPAQTLDSTVELVANTGHRLTLADSVHVPQNLLFVGGVLTPADILDDTKLFREEHGVVPPVALEKRVIINIDQPAPGVPVPVTLRLEVAGNTSTIFIEPRV